MTNTPHAYVEGWNDDLGCEACVVCGLGRSIAIHHVDRPEVPVSKATLQDLINRLDAVEDMLHLAGKQVTQVRLELNRRLKYTNMD